MSEEFDLIKRRPVHDDVPGVDFVVLLNISSGGVFPFEDFSALQPQTNYIPRWSSTFRLLTYDELIDVSLEKRMQWRALTYYANLAR